jgi:hypothetical protein
MIEIGLRRCSMRHKPKKAFFAFWSGTYGSRKPLAEGYCLAASLFPAKQHRRTG